MKTSIFMVFILIVILSLSSSGCLEYTDQLSSDFKLTESHSLYITNDSNLSIYHTCEKENAYNFYEKFTVKGNITNIGSTTIQFCSVNASFFNRKKNIPSSSNNDVESIVFRDIKPNETVNFTIEKTYEISKIWYYKINVAY